ncbi:MAG TPA: hypothetical protein VK787_02350 [Puia sp.]|nr:hypothetical protein [Puia sp.]
MKISDTIDLAKSLDFFAVLYNKDVDVIRSSASLNNKNPVLPKGVFDVVKISGEDRVTWQLQKNVRIAMIIIKINPAPVNYAAVGLSLRETE